MASVSVSKKIGLEKSIGFEKNGFEKIAKIFGIGFVQILGFVTH